MVRDFSRTLSFFCMGLFDIVLLIIIGGFVLFGLWFGLFHTLGSLLGTVVGVYVASRYYEQGADWLVRTTGWGENLSRVLIFALSFILINRLVGLAFWLLERFFRLLTRLPFIKSIDKLFGGLVGFFEGMITIGFILYFILKFPFSERLIEAITTSQVAPYALSMIDILLPLLPEGLRLLQSTVDYVEEIIR